MTHDPPRMTDTSFQQSRVVPNSLLQDKNDIPKRNGIKTGYCEIEIHKFANLIVFPDLPSFIMFVLSCLFLGFGRCDVMKRLHI